MSFSPANAITITSLYPAPGSGGVYEVATAGAFAVARRVATSSLRRRRILAMSSDASIAASLSSTSSSCSAVNTSVTQSEKRLTSKSGGGPAASGASMGGGSIIGSMTSRGVCHREQSFMREAQAFCCRRLRNFGLRSLTVLVPAAKMVSAAQRTPSRTSHTCMPPTTPTEPSSETTRE